MIHPEWPTATDDTTPNTHGGQMSERFCEQCGVTNDLHDGPDSCTSADSKARILESFPGLGTRP